MNVPEYYSNIRKDVVGFIERDPAQKILEIGCGAGSTLKYLKENGYASFVAGVEKAGECFSEPGDVIDEMIEADVEHLELPFDKKFDVILLLDVLEHLYEPYLLIKRLCGLLSPTGYIVVSIPNIRNYGVLKKLILRDRWDYGDSGILDRTHIRFFTKRSFLASLEREGIDAEVVGYRPNYENYGGLWRSTPLVRKLFICQHLFKLRFGI